MFVTVFVCDIEELQPYTTAQKCRVTSIPQDDITDINNASKDLFKKMLLFWAFYLLKNLGKKRKNDHRFHKNLKQHNCFQHVRNIFWAPNKDIRMTSEL